MNNSTVPTMTTAEAGRKGAYRLIELYPNIHRESVKKTHITLKERYGPDYYKKIRAIGVAKRRARVESEAKLHT